MNVLERILLITVRTQGFFLRDVEEIMLLLNKFLINSGVNLEQTNVL